MTMKTIIVVIFIVVSGATGYLITQSGNESPTVQDNRVFKTISVAEFSNLYDPNKHTVIDLRTPEEIASGTVVPDPIEIDFYRDDFIDQLNQLDKSQPYIVYCRSGNRSSQALKTMRGLGFNTVYELAGGYNAWAAT